ncbi:CPBP family intramembrane glutamic endopeptidase [Planomicrobium sp. CPCC 101079]|uniref:CPBP family intramembrane glutamic endopeptidase n=1 Tax=Planomicrobium sp. CPCC 101079 TaxID=2599618 RepID=UPI0011B7A1B3|nr:CPBP family intramembrane glutamic endopeptidase [Planomicrobium sp. CPCC 101079]TWT01436.1 CPBP family intramembrane metalloprotease [Planomicrobium sp. CPCC 101079]
MFEKMKLRYFTPFMLVAVIGAIIAMVAVEASEETFDVVFQLVMYVVVPAVFFGYYFRKQQASLSDVVFFKGVKPWLPKIAGLVLLSIAFSLGIFWLQLYMLLPIAPGLVDFFMEVPPIPDTPLYLGFMVFTIAILAPIAEEFMFRGLLLKRLAKKTSIWGGIIISSFLFGILHADIIGAFLFGVLASLLYLQTGNLLVPILMHMLNNSLAVALMFLAPATWPEPISIMEITDITAKAVPNAILLGISLIPMLAAIIWLSRGLRAEKREKATHSLV